MYTYGWGNHSDGQLGLGGIEDEQILVPKSVACLRGKKVREAACGLAHTLLLLRGGALYSCGCNDFGQLGHERPRRKPHCIASLETQRVTQIAAGAGHSMALNDNGQLFTWGKNAQGQLGHVAGGDGDRCATPRLVRHLLGVFIVQVACGHNHSLALSRDGVLYSWGANQHGELGHGTQSPQEGADVVRGLAAVPVHGVAAGGAHSMLVTVGGSVYGWGSNRFGQLGLGDEAPRSVPTVLRSLKFQKVRHVACGEDHTVALTMEGGVFTFGAGMYGQLGHNSKNSERLPRKVFELMGSEVCQIACGRQHTLALVRRSGRIYAFGLNGNGQLGVASVRAHLAPAPVTGTWGAYTDTPDGETPEEDEEDTSNKMEVDCPASTTSEHSRDREAGVAGRPPGDKRLCLSQTAERAAGASKQPKQANGRDDGDEDGLLFVNRIFSGGEQSFVVCSQRENAVEPIDQRRRAEAKSILCFSTEWLEMLEETLEDNLEDRLREVETIFSSRALINGSLVRDCDGGTACPFNQRYKELVQTVSQDEEVACCDPQVSLDAVDAAFAKLKAIADTHDGMTEKIAASVGRCAASLPPGGAAVQDSEELRVFLLLPQCAEFTAGVSDYERIHAPYAASAVALERCQPWVNKCIDLWFASLGSKHFGKLLDIFKRVVEHVIKLPQTTLEYVAKERQQTLVTTLSFLKKLHKISVTYGSIVPYDSFYIPELTSVVDIRMDYISWVNQQRFGRPPTYAVSFCQYPFVFDAAAKTMLLQTDAAIQMEAAMDEAQMQNMFSMMRVGAQTTLPVVLVLVRRDHIVQDTIAQLSKQRTSDLKKPIKVVFVGEEAVDQGGVLKEFFLLLIQEVLNPIYGMFQEFEETRSLWFSEQTFEEEGMFALIGMLCGLAIYNFQIVDLHFPLVLYKKLMDRPTTLADLRDLSPSMASSMEQLLQYDADDFTDVFDLTFEITRERFGETYSVELVPGGSRLTVTVDNRDDYVSRYVDYVLNESIGVQFKAFRAGLMRVFGNQEILKLFQPEELMAMMVGNENYDWEELEKGASYKDEYSSSHPTIKMFWEVFHELTVEEKKKFLLFLTGCDRIPILGMKSIKMYIQPVRGGEHYLPVAHTCFNLLDLPVYTDKQRLQDKLTLAVTCTKGFGLA